MGCRSVSFMDFWNLSSRPIVGLVGGNISFAPITISGLPDKTKTVLVVGMFKYTKRVDSSGLANKLSGAQAISVNDVGETASAIDMIDFPDAFLHTAANSAEAGTSIVGSIDVKSKVSGNGTCYLFWIGATAIGSSIYLYDVQIGLRIYFR